MLSSSILPASILEKSRMSLIRCSRQSADCLTMFRYRCCSAFERRGQRQFGHADDAVHGRADFVAHRGQELALGAVGRFGRVLGDSQLLFGLPQFVGQLLQFAVRGGQFLGAGFGGGRALGDPQFQGLVELLQLLEAFGVFQGGAGDRGDEVGQPLLVGAEQAAAPGSGRRRGRRRCGRARRWARRASIALRSRTRRRPRPSPRRRRRPCRPGARGAAARC